MSTIYSNNIITNIVWVSDIHFREIYLTDGNASERLKPFYEAFLNTIGKEQERNQINYIFITGDIAYSGSEADYKMFWDWFIVPLHELYKSLEKDNPKTKFPKIITIPGNHDINLKANSQFMEYLETRDTISNHYINRNEQLKLENKDPFLKSFENYSTTFKKQNETIWNDFFELGNLDMNSVYSDKRLYGYLVDSERQIIIILLNTAWYSIGSEFNKLLSEKSLNQVNKDNADGFTSEKYYKEYKNELTKLLKCKDEIVEYGTQIIGRNLLADVKSGLLQAITDNPNYVVITCMHHPLNWLNWHELYDYLPVVQEDFVLAKILNKSDLLLSGHEHIPIYKQPENIYGNCKHYEAGMFMEDNLNVLEGNVFFEHSRFSILTIDSDKPTVKESRFLYDPTRKEWERKDEFSNSFILYAKKKLLGKERMAKIIREVNNFKIADFLADKITPEHKISPVQVHSDYLSYNITLLDESRFCIIPLSSEFHKTQNPEYFMADYFLDKYIKESNKSFKILKIHFIWLDLLVDNKLTTEYLNPRNMQYDDTYHLITKWSDLLFNRFRDRFFARFCDKETGKTNPDLGNISLFESVMNVRFINEPVPFWHFEKLCR